MADDRAGWRDRLAGARHRTATVAGAPACCAPALLQALQVLQSCGRQLIGGIMTFVAYWLCGIPLGALLAFRCGWGLMGVWVGNASALCCGGPRVRVS